MEKQPAKPLEKPPETPPAQTDLPPQTPASVTDEIAALKYIHNFLDTHGSCAPGMVAKVLEEQAKKLTIPQKPSISRRQVSSFDKPPAECVAYLNELLDRARIGSSISDECRQANAHISIRRLHIDELNKYKAKLRQEHDKFQKFLELLFQTILRHFKKLIEEYGQEQVQVMLRSAAKYRAAIRDSHSIGDLLLTLPDRVGLAFLRQRFNLEELEDLFRISVIVKELPDKIEIQYKPGSPSALIAEHVDKLDKHQQPVDAEIREADIIIDHLQTFLYKVEHKNYYPIVV